MPATPPVVCTLRIDLIAAASTSNGCIDKLKVWVDMAISTPISLSYVVIECPVALTTEVPYYNSRLGYFPLSHPGYPDNAIGILRPSFIAFDQVSNSGYAESAQYPAAHPTFEMWFHRDATTDISSGAFAALYPDTSGQEGIYHFSQADGYSFTLTSVYPNGNKNGLGQTLYDTVTSNTITLSSVDCSSGGGGGGGDGDECPCDWTAVSTDCAVWVGQSAPTGEVVHWEDGQELFPFTPRGVF